jgi:drug/metabolite transporter (DMT)-like permease
MGRATRKYPFQQIAAVEAIVCAAMMALTFPVIEKPYVAWNSTVIWAILVTGLLGTAAAFTVQAWAQQFTPPTHTALIFSLEPAFAWLTSLIVLREHLGGRGGVGAALILAGVLLSELKGSTQAATKDEVGPDIGAANGADLKSCGAPDLPANSCDPERGQGPL